MTRLARVLAIALLTLCSAALPAFAQSLDQAKAAGLVGEKVDGFLGVVDANAPAEVRAMVDRINAERRAKYAEIANNQNAPMDAVAKIAGQKLTERAPSGQYVLGADGRWRRK
jgi:uncharacterized protein YdbL (DUF1318 family)